MLPATTRDEAQRLQREAASDYKLAAGRARGISYASLQRQSGSSKQARRRIAERSKNPT